MCGMNRIADPLNITRGHGVDMIKPWGGWDTKIDPAGIMDRMTPKAPEVVQAKSEPTPTPVTVPRTSGYTGLQIRT